MWKTLRDIATFSMFLFLFSYIFALLGMELFAYKVMKSADDKTVNSGGIYPLNNFNYFY